MSKHISILRKMSAPAAGIALVAFAVLLIPGSTLAATKHTSRAKKPVAHASKPRKAHQTSPRLQGVSYKTVTRRRYAHHRRVWRHRVILPKQPSRDRTEQIQEALQRGGFYRGEPNGKWDSAMSDSLRRFQAAKGLPPTGKLDAISLQKMGLGSDVAGVSAPRPSTGNPTASQSASAAPKNPGN